MIQFGLGVLASFIGGYALALSGILNSWLPFQQFRNIGVTKIFKDQEAAIKTLMRDIRKSRRLSVLTMKGDSFSNPTMPLSEVLRFSHIEQRYLVSDLRNPYLEKRGKELGMNMSESVRRSIANFEEAKKRNGSIHVRRHEEIVRFRLILLDECLFLSFQEVNKPGKSTSMLKIHRNSPIYRNFASLFDDLWDRYA